MAAKIVIVVPPLYVALLTSKTCFSFFDNQYKLKICKKQYTDGAKQLARLFFINRKVTFKNSLPS